MIFPRQIAKGRAVRSMPVGLSRRIFFGILAVVLASMVLIGGSFALDMYRAYDRIDGRSNIVHSPFGDIEYADGGEGPDVLVVHGSGGGFDQGEIMVRSVLGNDFHWIVPSRFGYLRSTFIEGATFDDQARAYSFLLDNLGIDQVAVVALSHGGPSALLFAAMYPERVSSLAMISCGVASSSAEDQAHADRKGNLLVKVYEHDLLYWSLTRFFRKQFIGLMGASGELYSDLSPGQRALVNEVIDYMNPSSLRSSGAAFDNKASMPNERVSKIRLLSSCFMQGTIHCNSFTMLNTPRHIFRGPGLSVSIEGASFDDSGAGAIREEIKRHIMKNSGLH